MDRYRISWSVRHAEIRDRCVIGRGTDCDVSIPDRNLSRRHCELTVCAHGVVVRDLGSKNGVRVDGARIDGSLLLIGEHTIQVGKTKLRIAPAADIPPVSRAEWDEPTLRTGLELATTELFQQVLQVALEHARAGRVARAERVSEAHLAKLLRQAIAAERVEPARLDAATGLALTMAEAGSPRWLGYVLELHLALERNMSGPTARRFLAVMSEHPKSVDAELIRMYGEQSRPAAKAADQAPTETAETHAVPLEGSDERSPSRWSRFLGQLGWSRAVS